MRHRPVRAAARTMRSVSGDATASWRAPVRRRQAAPLQHNAMNSECEDRCAGEERVRRRKICCARVGEQICAREPQRATTRATRMSSLAPCGSAPTGSRRGNEISEREQHAVEDHQRIDRVRDGDRVRARDHRDAVENRKREQHAGDAPARAAGVGDEQKDRERERQLDQEREQRVGHLWLTARRSGDASEETSVSSFRAGLNGKWVEVGSVKRQGSR